MYSGNYYITTINPLRTFFSPTVIVGCSVSCTYFIAVLPMITVNSSLLGNILGVRKCYITSMLLLFCTKISESLAQKTVLFQNGMYTFWKMYESNTFIRDWRDMNIDLKDNLSPKMTKYTYRRQIFADTGGLDVCRQLETKSPMCDALTHIIIIPKCFSLMLNLHVLFQRPWTLHSQCKKNKFLPNLETGRSKTLIYDTSRQLNLNANAFSTEPADYNLNCQANWLLTAIPTIRLRAAGQKCRGEQRCEVVELNFSGSFGGDGSLMTTKESLQTENRLHFKGNWENQGRQREQDILSLCNYQQGALEQGMSQLSKTSPQQL